jgi:hypothetical protein
MIKLMRPIFVIFALTGSFFQQSLAETSEPLASGFRAPRHWRLGLSVAGIMKQDFAPESAILFGPSSFWEFETSQRSSMGIHAAYRVSTDGAKLSQLGYGLILKHKLGEVSPEIQNNWYLSYGLLLQVIRAKDRQGTGTAHDTKLCVGKDFGGDKTWFLEASAHYSRLRYFNAEDINLDYFELVVGREI